MDWCRVCCTTHGQEGSCPGELLATGAERHAWRVTVDTPHGAETFGVLVAPAGSAWRARILTYPNALWVIPGSSATMKFVGAHPREAEKQAIEMIERVCEHRGFRKHEVLPPVEPAPIDPERAPEPRGTVPAPPVAVRKVLSTTVHFGHTKASQEGLTANVSERGMFVSTEKPLDPGAAIRLRVILDAYTVPLRGVVVWSRRNLEPGRPPGMGVRILLPSNLYTEYVAQLP